MYLWGNLSAMGNCVITGDKSKVIVILCRLFPTFREIISRTDLAIRFPVVGKALQRNSNLSCLLLCVAVHLAVHM